MRASLGLGLRSWRHDAGSVAAVASEAWERGLSYGDDADHLSWLVSDHAFLLPDHALQTVERDLDAIFAVYRRANELYCASLDGEEPSWIAVLAEFGLTAHEIAGMRRIARAAAMPKTCRLEYLSASDCRQVAEAQWVSGGMGLFAGVDWLYARHCSVPGTTQLPLSTNWVTALDQDAPDGRAGTVAAVRRPWLGSERFLSACARDEVGRAYVAADREDVAAWLEGTTASPRLDKVGLVYGAGFSRLLSEQAYTRLVNRSLRGDLRVEAPLNLLFRQKWVLTLPFDDTLGASFPTRARTIIPPSVLVRDGPIDCRLLVACSDAWREPERLAAVDDILALARLPESVRRRLILKCGSGVPPYYSNGRGVFRLTGSRQYALGILEQVKMRVSAGEPWILQPFVGEKYGLFTLSAADETPSYVKLMAFGSVSSTRSRVLGLLANHGRHWKVGGRRPGIDAAGHQMGTAFAAVWVAAPGA